MGKGRTMEGGRQSLLSFESASGLTLDFHVAMSPRLVRRHYNRSDQRTLQT
jgi:hypothetical protein